jgi:tetratricopeptide repeat protein 21B
MEPRVLINYYLRKGWFDHAQRLCESLLEKKGSDPVLQFWRAFAIAQERSYSSAIRELESLKKKKDVELPCLHALLYAHSQCKLVDHDELAQLEVQLVMAEEHATEQSLLLCANLFWHIHEPAKARKILDQLLSSRSKTDSATQLRASVLRGWIDLTVEPKTKRDADVRENAIHYLDQVKENDAERLLGLAKFYDLKKNFSKALECFDELLVKHAWFPHGVSEKALVLLKMGQWDQCLDSVERALSDNPRDLEALRIRILHLLSRDGKPREAATHIRELGDALKKSEPSNPQLYYEMAACNARLSDRNHEVLHCNLALIEQAIQLHPESGVYRAERGYQRSLLEDYSEAMDAYKDALRLDESNEMALHGLIYCQIKLGQLDDASQQMEFLSVVQESMGASAGFVFLQALLSGSKDKDRGRQVQLLNKSVQLHMDHLKTTIQHADVSTHELMRQLNPLFLVEVSTEFLRQDSPPQGGGEDEAASVVAKGISILEKLVKKSPGFLRAQFVLAQAYFVATRLDDAYHTCNMLLKMDPAHAQAHMLQARICMERDHMRAASACLDLALSHDFSIRQSLAYCIVKAKLLETSGDVRDAYQAVQAAMKMLTPSTTTGSGPPAKGKRVGASAAQLPPSPISSELAQFDRASVYIQMAQVLSQLNDVPEATRIVREALQVFR